MVDKESFIDAAPLLFGKGFDQRARDHTEAIKSLKKTITDLFRGATPHSPGEVGHSGAGGQGNSTELPRRGKELSKSYLDCTNKIITNVKPYKLPLRDRADTHYRGSDRYQGVKLCNPHCKKVHNRSEVTDTHQVSESTLTSRQSTILGLPILHLALTQLNPCC